MELLIYHVDAAHNLVIVLHNGKVKLHLQHMIIEDKKVSHYSLIKMEPKHKSKKYGMRSTTHEIIFE